MCILLAVSCGERKAKAIQQAQNASEKSRSEEFPDPVVYTYKIVKEYPHATDSYTQGLLWHGGDLYESTGNYGSSRLMKVNPETGKPIIKTELDRNYFGEGIAAIGNRIYMLTWQEGKAFVYDADNLTLLNTLTYSGEGWGLTADGSRLYTTDGSDIISVRNPDSFNVERTIHVTQKGRPVNLLNELEWIEGKIWANVYMYSEVVIIDPKTGFIEGIIDFSGIKSNSDRLRNDDVFNGIAYKEDEKRLFVTGKNWNKLYEVEVIKN